MFGVEQYVICLMIWNTQRFAKSEESFLNQNAINNSKLAMKYGLDVTSRTNKGVTSGISFPQGNRSKLGLILNPTGFPKIRNTAVKTYFPDASITAQVVKTTTPHHLEKNNVSPEMQGRTEEMLSNSEKHYNEPNIQAMKEWHEDKNCTLQVRQKSKLEFYNRILYDKAGAFQMNLNITINYTSDHGIILPHQWLWVYEGTLAFLKMPRAATIWSLGLLSLYYKNPVNITIDPQNGSNSCEDFQLTIGENESDYMIGEAFGNMMKDLVLKDERYYTSHWCYMKIHLHKSDMIFDDIFFGTKPSVQYVCCSYDLDHSTETLIKCSDSHLYDSVWWDVPLGVGLLMLLYFPLLFMSVSGKIHKQIMKSSAVIDDEANRSHNVQAGGHGRPPAIIRHGYMNDMVFHNGKSPVTVFTLLKSIISKLIPTKQKSKSRIAIFLFSLLTLVIPGIEVLTYSAFLSEYAESVANYNISFGFSSMLAGWKTSRNCKFSIIGGPYIALALYLVTGWILMLSPTVMANQIYRGVQDSDETTKSILSIDLRKKESLGSIEIRKHRNGYTRLSRLQVCHLYMLINPEFWIFAGKIVKMRFCAFASKLKRHIPFKMVRFLILSFCFSFYVVFSLIELIIGAVYFAFPMVSFLFCTTVGFSLGLNKYMSVRVTPRYPRLGFILRIPAGAIVFFLLIFHLYVFTVIFLDSFFFLSRILLFTYTAVVAYPRETYGYFMLILFSVYCGFNKLFEFGNIYKLILKITIKVCNQDDAMKDYIVHKQDIDNNVFHGIPKSMFEYLVDRIRPRRVHIFHTIIRLGSMIFILSVSIILIQRFKKYEDISLLVHVFVTLFICALPTIYSSVVSQEKEKNKLTRKIKKHLRIWLLSEKQANRDLQQ